MYLSTNSRLSHIKTILITTKDSAGITYAEGRVGIGEEFGELSPKLKFGGPLLLFEKGR
jgi:hypothetical protein